VGSFGEVQKCVLKGKDEGATFALKKVVLQEPAARDGFPPTALREIKLLKQCAHENIVRLYEVAINNNGSHACETRAGRWRPHCAGPFLVSHCTPPRPYSHGEPAEGHILLHGL
jgi:serine/threonine protein kinase